ncbi:hypothetical protein [Paracoccus sediminilitoris]|uniref:hypothetical protein n=1 Tax=Paracoccus sediminilitoris TaxID=2202419 RepID=UPI0027299397|nr:hypothetical protein [Paracoccus sediminilitoris]
MFHTPQTKLTERHDADGRAAAIALDLEQAAAGADPAFYAARALGSLDHAAYTGPISMPSAQRIKSAIDAVRPRLLALGDEPEHYVFVLAALEAARTRVDRWAHPAPPRLRDPSSGVAADLVRWLAKSCDMACCFLEVTGKSRFPVGAELPNMNVRAVPIRKRRK